MLVTCCKRESSKIQNDVNMNMILFTQIYRARPRRVVDDTEIVIELY